MKPRKSVVASTEVRCSRSDYVPRTAGRSPLARPGALLAERAGRAGRRRPGGESGPSIRPSVNRRARLEQVRQSINATPHRDRVPRWLNRRGKQRPGRAASARVRSIEPASCYPLRRLASGTAQRTRRGQVARIRPRRSSAASNPERCSPARTPVTRRPARNDATPEPNRSTVDAELAGARPSAFAPGPHRPVAPPEPP